MDRLPKTFNKSDTEFINNVLVPAIEELQDRTRNLEQRLDALSVDKKSTTPSECSLADKFEEAYYKMEHAQTITGNCKLAARIAHEHYKQKLEKVLNALPHLTGGEHNYIRKELFGKDDE